MTSPPELLHSPEEVQYITMHYIGSNEGNYIHSLQVYNVYTVLSVALLAPPPLHCGVCMVYISIYNRLPPPQFSRS